MTETALIVGATGRTGRLALDALLQRGWSLRALVRHPPAELLPPQVEVRPGGLADQPAVAAAVSGVRAVLYMASGGASEGSHPRAVDFEGVAALAEAAAQAGVGRFVLLSSAAVTQPEHPHNSSLRNVLKWKLRGEQRLREQPVPHTIVRALGLRDRPGAVQGVRLLQGDRIAYGEDIARADVACFLADVLCAAERGAATGETAGFAPDFDQGSLINATFEVYNDARIPGGAWRSARASLLADPAPK